MAYTVICKGCGKEFESSAKRKQLYCSDACRKRVERRPAAIKTDIPISKTDAPEWLNDTARLYWDKISPILRQRGHLNVLSEDSFAELCDIYSRLRDINMAINETNRSLLQIDDKWSANDGSQTQSFKESALSDLKRKYSAKFLDYSKQFYLTPLSNKGSFGIDVQKEEEDDLF